MAGIAGTLKLKSLGENWVERSMSKISITSKRLNEIESIKEIWPLVYKTSARLLTIGCFKDH